LQAICLYVYVLERIREKYIGNSLSFFPLYKVGKANQNEALLWKIAFLGMKKPTIGAGTFSPSPMLVFYITSFRKCIPAWRLA
jgi:hypothetical protein